MDQRPPSIFKIKKNIENKHPTQVFGRVIAQSDHQISIEDHSDSIQVKISEPISDHLGHWVLGTMAFQNENWILEKLSILSKGSETFKKGQWADFQFQEKLKFKNIQKRAQFFSETRKWFSQEGFLEVETPALVPSPGLEIHLFGFKTHFHSRSNNKTQAKEFHLPTSPEFHMKRLLSGGFSDIFQLSKCFRNGDLSPHHEPEFTMLEFYRVFYSYEKIMEDCQSLVEYLSIQLNLENQNYFKKENWKIISVNDLFLEYLGHPLPEENSKEGLINIGKSLGIPMDPTFEWDDLFFLLFLNKIEPHLGQMQPTIVIEYPKEMASLSQISKNNPRVADRFEMYLKGVEIANGFGELTDAKEQRNRFEQDQSKRSSIYGEPQPEDPGFLQALEEGLPPCSGVAVGMDRLLMVLLGLKQIQDVISFPHFKD